MIRASAPYTSGQGSFVLLKNGLHQGSMGRQSEHITPAESAELRMRGPSGT